jgi:hypothetical protein
VPKAKKILASAIVSFFQKQEMENSLQEKCKEFVDKIGVIKKHFVAQIVCKRAKEEVLHTYWDQMVFKIDTKADKLARPDEEAYKLIKMIRKAPQEIRDSVIKRYCYQCRSLYSIAFL